jgi:hypothetical protein
LGVLERDYPPSPQQHNNILFESVIAPPPKQQHNAQHTTQTHAAVARVAAEPRRVAGERVEEHRLRLGVRDRRRRALLRL